MSHHRPTPGTLQEIIPELSLNLLLKDTVKDVVYYITDSENPQETCLSTMDSSKPS